MENRDWKAENDRETSEKFNYLQMVALHFTTRDVDLPLPVRAKNLDMPLIDFVEKAKTTNKSFFSFNSVSCDLL